MLIVLSMTTSQYPNDTEMVLEYPIRRGRVSDGISGFDSPRLAELFSTTTWPPFDSMPSEEASGASGIDAGAGAASAVDAMSEAVRKRSRLAIVGRVRGGVCERNSRNQTAVGTQGCRSYNTRVFENAFKVRRGDILLVSAVQGYVGGTRLCRLLRNNMI